MIDTTYVRLAQAAEMLNRDADTLLIAAAEGRVRAFWLLNAIVDAECGRYEETDGEPDEPPDMWVPCDMGLRHFMFIPLERDEAAEMLKNQEIEARADWLTKPDGERNQWRPFGGWSEDGGGLSAPDLRVTRGCVFFERADVEAIRRRLRRRIRTASQSRQRGGVHLFRGMAS